MKRKTVVTLLQIVFFTGLAIFLIVWQMQHMNAAEKAEMFASMRQVRYWFMFPVLLVGFLSHLFRALRWRLLMEPLQIHPTTANTFFAVMIGYLVNSFLPRFGEVAKCTVLAKYEKVPADKMVGTIVAERAFDLVCLIGVILLSLALQAGVIGGFAAAKWHQLRAARGHTLLYVLIGLVLLILLLAFFYRRIRRTRVGRAIKGIGDGVKSIMHIRKRGLFLVYTVALWGSYLAMILLGFWAMPATDQLGPFAALTVLAFGSISVIITPGGIGAYPPIVAAILVLYGISLPEGNAFGWVAWSVQTGVILLLGLISLILLPIYNRTVHNAQAPVDTAQDH